MGGGGDKVCLSFLALFQRDDQASDEGARKEEQEKKCGDTGQAYDEPEILDLALLFFQ